MVGAGFILKPGLDSLAFGRFSKSCSSMPFFYCVRVACSTGLPFLILNAQIVQYLLLKALPSASLRASCGLLIVHGSLLFGFSFWMG